MSTGDTEEKVVPVSYVERQVQASGASTVQQPKEGCGCGSSGGGCSCGGKTSANKELAKVYAIGQLGLEFKHDARRRAIAQRLEGDPANPLHLLAHLDKHPYEAEKVVWTLTMDGVPFMTILPSGAFAQDAYKFLVNTMREQITDGVQVSIAGKVVGEVKLKDNTIPVVRPDLACMYSWTRAALLRAVFGEGSDRGQSSDSHHEKLTHISQFLDRVNYGLRNFGMTPEDRALNFAVTNAYHVGDIFASALHDHLEFETVQVTRSPISRPDTDLWEVVLRFFDPQKITERARKEWRITVDLTDTCPTVVGEPRSWYIR